MIEYKTLTHLEADDFRRLNQGYILTEKYVVEKRETVETAVLSLHLMPLEQPYIKQGMTDETDIQRLPQVISQGLWRTGSSPERMTVTRSWALL